jgi:hypothetical protein
LVDKYRRFQHVPLLLSGIALAENDQEFIRATAIAKMTVEPIASTTSKPNMMPRSPTSHASTAAKIMAMIAAAVVMESIGEAPDGVPPFYPPSIHSAALI